MTEPDSRVQKKMRQIQGLLAIANDERADEAHREHAMAKAMEMMAAHGVSEMMLGIHRDASEDKIITRTIPISGAYSYEQMNLAGQIGYALNCRHNYRHWRDVVSSVTIVGYQSDVERVEVLYTSLLLQALNGMKHERPYSYATASETRLYRKSWLRGFAARVHNRLVVAEQAARSKYDHEHASTGDSAPGTALVFQGRSAQVGAFYDAEFSDLKTARPKRQIDPDAVRAGAKAGSRADIGGTRLGETQRPALRG